MSIEPKFDFYEVVTVSSNESHLKQIVGLQGVILGRSANELGDWAYAVQLSDMNEVWTLSENVLITTGRSLRRDDIYDGESLKVSVDPKTGKGRLVEEDYEKGNPV